MTDIMEYIKEKKSVFYKNENALKDPTDYLKSLDIGLADIENAYKRFTRFKPLIKKLFPVTGDGSIKSSLVKADNLKKNIYPDLKGELFLKLDSHLPIAGSIKARGGIHEVLKFTEDLLLFNGLIDKNDNYEIISCEKIRSFLSDYTVSVASTGNLGLSIGITSKALGYKAKVHMSREAETWKKKRLLDIGVTVVEHDGDFNYTAYCARLEAEKEEKTHFVDDERSKELFLGYSVSCLEIIDQFKEHGISFSQGKPINLYLPCGVGGAPGGISFGFKTVFGENVRTFFAEPVSSPSMLLGVFTRLFDKINIYEYGLDNKTLLDGLAVPVPSAFVAPMMEKLCDGFYTVNDEDMFKYLYFIKEYEDIKIEPSAAAGAYGPAFIDSEGIHIIWTTGGLFVPDEIYDTMYERGRLLCLQK